jgi:hypothetical protein
LPVLDCLVVAGAGGMLMGTVDRGVHADGPLDLADRVGLGLRVRQQPVPGAVLLPAAKPLVAGLPGPIALGQVTPGCTGVVCPGFYRGGLLDSCAT